MPLLFPSGNPYRRPTERLEYQLFNEDYFSGADIHLFFGNIWVDEIVGLEFQLEEQVMPIYGYNSFTFDAVMRGRRVVSGRFTINFKTAGYLKTILENASAIESQINEMTSNGKLSPTDFQKYKLDDILKQSGKKSFDELAKQYENAIWGTTDDTENLLNYDNQTFFPNAQYGFDLKIHYGAVSESNIQVPITTNYARTFSNQKPNISVETINGVQLTGMSKNGMSTGSDGIPITETYTFLARDINGPLFLK